jgi:hypothetical protein
MAGGNVSRVAALYPAGLRPMSAVRQLREPVETEPAGSS